MKKLLLTIFVLAAIVALTVVPASALTMSQPFELDKSGETWYQFVDNTTKKTTYFKFEYDGDRIEEGTQVILWGFDKEAGPMDEELIAGIGSDSGKPLFDQLNKVFLFSILPPGASELKTSVKVYIQNDGINKMFYVDTAGATQSEIDDIHFYDFTKAAKFSDVKLTTPDGEEASFSMMAANYETNYLFLSPNNPVPPQEKSGSMFLSEPVWIVIIVALMAICFAGGTAFGIKKNKAPKAE